jgi:ubiquinone/menaquinone biosynthesis C-methylase UbiE
MPVDYNSLAQDYERHRQVMPEVLKGLVEIGSLGAESPVLDVGCGTGNYTLALESSLGCSCWGVDPSRQMLARARERTRRAHFQIGKAEQLDFPSGFFDLVFSVDVIHHVSNRPAYFREAYRVLKEGGRVCTVTDSEEIIRRRQPLSVYFPETVEIELQRYPRIADLRTMMLASGFTCLQETLVEHAYEMTDIEKFRSKAFSCLHLIPAEAFERGIQRMRGDLQEAPIPAVSRYVLLWGVKPSG